MQYSIRHALPGRIRLHIAVLRHRTELSDAMLAWLQSQPWIRAARVNFGCASLIIDYDPARQGELDGLLFAFGHASVQDLATIAAMAPPAPVKREEALPRRRFPLLLPTLSLGLAFSANPLVMAVNTPLILWNAVPIFKRAWHVWSRERRLNIDFLDALAISASLVQRLMVTGALITWLICLGDWIRDLTAAGSKRAVGQLLEFQDKTAWLVRDGQIVSVPARDLAIGDIIVVHHG